MASARRMVEEKPALLAGVPEQLLCQFVLDCGHKPKVTEFYYDMISKGAPVTAASIKMVQGRKQPYEPPLRLVRFNELLRR